MVVCSLEVNKNPFRPKEENEELCGPKVSYLSAIDVLMYLANSTRSDIVFSINLLARYSFAPTRKQCNRIKHILRYICEISDMGLYYSKESKSQLIGYANTGYLSCTHKAQSQTGYVFTYDGTTISWRSIKQTMVSTSSNYSESLIIHEASRECVYNLGQ